MITLPPVPVHYDAPAAAPPGADAEPLVVPFRVLVDQQEKAPFAFSGLRATSRQKHRPLIVPLVTAHLKTGDYSLEGFEDRVAVERKSLDDLFGTLAGGRERFQREHERMAVMIAAGGACCVVIEGSLEDAMLRPPSRLNPLSVRRTWLSWSQEFGVPWHWCGTRRLAEEVAFDFLDRQWRKLTEPAARE